MALTATKTAIFNRISTNPHNQFTIIADTYKAFGLAAPTRALDIKQLVNAEGQNVTATAHRLTLEALTTTTDPDEWYADALDQIREAQARETLATAFNRNFNDAVTRCLPTYLADAVDDITPAVEKTIKRLTAAAKKLPQGKQALEAEANLTNDSGAALQEARTVLALLGQAASIYQVTTPGETPVALNALLPIISLPNATVEQIRSSYGEDVTVLNKAALTATYTIRKLAIDAKDNTDLALVNIARGNYEGVTLSLATPQQARERKSNATTAHQRQTIHEGAVILH